MLELILKGRPRFYLWLCFLGAIFGLGFIVYIFQANIGLAITGMSRDVSWGLCSPPTSTITRSSNGSSSSANSWPWVP